MKSFLFAAFALTAADAATKVAVIELGKGGTVRRTTSKSTEASVEGVTSFWSALHSQGRRKLQQAGMTVVPDLFNKADSSVVIGLKGSGVNLDAMPSVNEMVSREGKQGVVGHMEIAGSQCDSLMSSVDDVEIAETPDVAPVKKQADKAGLSGFKVLVNSADASNVDHQLTTILEEMDRSANEAGKTVIVHLIVEEDMAVTRRRLEQEEGEEGEGEEEEGEGEDEGENEENQDGENNAEDDNNNGKGDNGYYGYGYYNAYGEWVTPYKTMFQIQYFNIVLWTAVGLTIALFFTIYLMMFMPLEADTLLFGESAKLMGDD